MDNHVTFQELGIASQLVERLAALSITTPTTVQQQAIPPLSQGSSLVFQSETGTGKTLAYLLPLLQQIDESIQQIQLLIVAPTHELASQIKSQIQLVTDIPAVLLIGGAPIKRQVEMLKKKPLIAVGGAARLMELVYLKKLKVHQVKAIVLDEADRLLAPELRDDTTALCQALPAEVQLAACSATINGKTEKIIQSLVRRQQDEGELEKRILPPEDILQKKITHIAIYSETRDKVDTLRRLLVAEMEAANKEQPLKAMVFTARPADVDIILSKLTYKKMQCSALHAKQDKVKRKQALDQFRKGSCPVLITSDLAARGLDIPDVTHIIQLDMPSNMDFFVHRAGRTGRNGRSGLNIVIGDGYEMRQLAAAEKKLHLVVYPKVLYKGKLVAPEQEP
ncbi:MAG: DEAD/DEAH box helicase [Spirochaetaceae bacterium]|nr:DEAD/DEAH box helicase [Spirochaetaceae bacterium]